jgi:predicted nucleic acid-binding protein
VSGFVLEASLAAAWFLPDEKTGAADQLMDELESTVAVVPALFWFEMRSLLLNAERRQRLRLGEAALSMAQLRSLPLEDAGSGLDHPILTVAGRYMLSAYDASYLALAIQRGLPLATGDMKLVTAAAAEQVPVLGPYANG